ncbi:putative dehydrogenase [Hypnocyclicus thermotrophus]|uniref:Dehydrogenase n=1 Tax=Hypnocyclicus thermotrophus TaxID=1627895 RepID=A0AA46E0G1_9FUSO|nr:Gfo/Idh/MocA family oxidoreductase [Hypnocyclicus thermotrophus]TDT72574.1 putative dehydrogenase [Hypnocyclicus thermotrophus]
MLNWGIIGAGNIATKFMNDFRYVLGGRMIAVASKSLDKAKKFAKKYEIKNYYDSYEELLNNKEIDVVYIATTHNFHYENMKSCIEHGKNILCEKPITLNKNQFEEIIKLAKEKNLFVMEAMWMYFIPAIERAVEWIKEDEIGDIKLIKAEFGLKIPFDPQARLYNKELGGGALLDLGIYPISFACFLANSEYEQVESMAIKGDTGVDEYVSILIKFKNGIQAELSTSSRQNFENRAFVYGTKGSLSLEKFWMCKEMQLRTKTRIINYTDEGRYNGYNFEADEVCKCIQEGKLESDIASHSKTLQVLEIMDLIRKKHGVIYPVEEE